MKIPEKHLKNVWRSTYSPSVTVTGIIKKFNSVTTTYVVVNNIIAEEVPFYIQ